MNYQQLLDHARNKYRTDPGNRKMWEAFGKSIKSKMQSKGVEERLTVKEVEEILC